MAYKIYRLDNSASRQTNEWRLIFVCSLENRNDAISMLHEMTSIDPEFCSWLETATSYCNRVGIVHRRMYHLIEPGKNFDDLRKSIVLGLTNN